MTRALAALALAAALATAPAAAQPASPTAAFGPPPALTLVVADVGSLFGLNVGLDDMLDEVDSMADGFTDEFAGWGEFLYVCFFAIQFLLIGATMVVKGPFAIASYRPIHALNPFANFFFFLLAGAIGYLFVSHSYYVDAGGADRGWVLWLYDFFREAGYETGCDGGGSSVFGIVGSCDAEGIASVGMRMSGAMMVLSQEAGNTGSNPVNWLANAAGASSGVFGAFTVLAVQMTLTEIAFKLAIVTAPLFLATIVFRPLSGMSTGYINFILYLGVKLFVLYLVAGLASFVAVRWLEAIIAQVLAAMLTSGTGTPMGAGGLFTFNLSVLTISMLFLAMTLYLPARIAQAVSGHLQLDLNAILFRGELPIAVD